MRWQSFLKKTKFKQFIKLVYFIVFLLLISFLVLAFSSRASLHDIFTTGRISVLNDRDSKIVRDIIVDASIINNCPGGITVLTKDILQKIAQKRPNWRFNVLICENNKLFDELRALENIHFIFVRLFYHPIYDIWFNILNFITLGFFRDKLIQLIYYNTIFLDNKCDLFWDPDGEDSIVNNFSIPKIATIHDLLHIDKPELGLYKKIVDLSTKRTLESIKYSKKIITVSNFSKNRIVDKYGVDKNFVTTIPIRHADRLNFSLTEKDIDVTLKKYNLSPRKYIIYVSQYLKNKNHCRLIQAFSQIIHKEKINDEKLKLVLVGNMARSEGKLEKFAKQYNDGNNIVFTGEISNKDLQVLLSNALCFVHPSLYEGFGMPIIEAMSCGVPVACSNQTSLPEVAGDAALYFNPYNIDEISAAILKIIKNSDLRMQLVKKGYERAKEFQNTDKMIEDYINVFENVMKNVNEIKSGSKT